MTGQVKGVATDAVNGSVFTVLAHNSDILVIQTHAGIDLEDAHLSHASAMYGAFNLGLHVEDDPKTVLQHRGQLLGFINEYLHTHKPAAKSATKALGALDSIELNPRLPAPIERIYWLNQVHGNRVVTMQDKPISKQSVVDTSQLSKLSSGAAISVDSSANDTLTDSNNEINHALRSTASLALLEAPLLLPPDADAMVTALPQTALAIMTADCVPIMLYGATAQHEQQPAAQIAAIHAGWKGLANGVIAKTYASLRQNSPLNSAQVDSDALNRDPLSSAPLPSPIQAWIGASIGAACYEVSLGVVAQLLAGCQQLGMATAVIEQHVVGSHDDPNKAWLDLPLLARLQLEALGIQVMSSSSPCSYSDSQYYSYRRMTHRQHSNTGRMALLIMRLNNKEEVEAYSAL